VEHVALNISFGDLQHRIGEQALTSVDANMEPDVPMVGYKRQTEGQSLEGRLGDRN